MLIEVSRTGVKENKHTAGVCIDFSKALAILIALWQPSRQYFNLKTRCLSSWKLLCRQEAKRMLKISGYSISCRQHT